MADAPSWADDVVVTPTAPGGPAWADPAVVAPPVDKYRQAAIEERDRLTKDGGVLSGKGFFGGLHDYTQRAGQGAGLNWTDELAAGINTPFEMLKRGVGPGEAYNYTSAREKLAHEKTNENTEGFGGSLAEVAGGLATGAGVLGSGTRAAAAAIPLTKAVIPASVVNAVGNIGKGAAFGAVAGAGAGDTLEERGQQALMGGVLGGALGGVTPAIVTGAQKSAALLQLPRLRDPTKVATEQIAEVARTAGVEPAELVRRIADANAAGQPFTVADALGKEGQRKLTAMAKVPGPQRDQITETLMARDLNMPNRVGNEVGTALGAPGTAQQAGEQLIEQAGRQAAPVYRQAEQIPTWSPRLQEFIDDPIARQGLRHGVELQRLRSVGSDTPFNPRDAMITGFNEAGDPIISGVPNMQTLHTLKVGIDRMIEGEINPQTHRLNARGQALAGFRDRMLREIDSENPTYGVARRLYGGPMEVNAAIRAGQEMPTVAGGRSADTLRAFDALPPTAQQGVRIGYADAVREPLERTGNLPTILRQKSIKGADELDALSLYQGPNQPGAPSQLRQRLNREEGMQRTSKQALGGSATVENAADVANTPGAQDILGFAGNLAAGRWGAAGRTGVEALQRFGRGESEAQRVAITRQLLETNPEAVQAMADRIAEHELRRRGVNPFVNRPPRYGVGQ